MKLYASNPLCGLFLLLSLVLVGGPVTAQHISEQVMEAAVAASAVEQVNVNLADAVTMARVLDGIGQSRAEAIIRHREEHGDFESLEDVTLVRGIGEQTIMRNRDRIVFE